MKHITKIIGVLILMFSLVACDEESNFKESDIQLVPVYALTDISGANMPLAINIYKEQPLIIEYSSAVNASKFKSGGFSDTSTDTTYEFSIGKIVDVLDNEGNKTGEATIGYWVSADKITGEGTLSIVTDVTEVFNVKVEEKEVYN